MTNPKFKKPTKYVCWLFRKEKTSGMNIEQVRELCSGLSLSKSPHQILELIKKEGKLLDSARYFAASCESYNHHRLAGRLGYLDLMNKMPGGSSISAYIERVKGILRPEIIEYMNKNKDYFQAAVTEVDKRYGRDFDWLKFMSHENSYLLRNGYQGEIIETPALMHFRVFAELYHKDDNVEGSLAEALCAYDMATRHYFSFASPVFFNSGRKKPNLCSCFLMGPEDNLDSIMDCSKFAAKVSKAKGGIGYNASRLRHSTIGDEGMSGGIMPFLIAYDKLIVCVDQTGKRNGASTVFLQAHHIDLLPFIRATLKNIKESERFETLNTAIVFPDIFWERLKEEGKWTLFCPAVFPGLNETYGEEYRKLYLQYESMDLSSEPQKAKYRVTVNTVDVINALTDSQVMSGMPYVLHKDSVNSCSNQVNMNSQNPCHREVIQSSNLCMEIVQQSSKTEISACNLGQMSPKEFITKDRNFDFERFGFVVRAVVKLLDKVIDRTNYVLPEIRTSNMRHRPIGLGMSGYADMLDLMKIPYLSDEASELNRKIFACMYYNAIVASLELSLSNGPYETFFGSPLSEGKFSFDLWRERMKFLNPEEQEVLPIHPEEWGQPSLYIEDLGSVLRPSWNDLRDLVKKYGVRNSQLLAIMPSASTSRLMGNAENTEAHQSTIYIRNFMKSSAIVINPQLFRELNDDLGVWSSDLAEFIVSQGGSVARIPEFLSATGELPDGVSQSNLTSVCERYKTMFELKQLKIFRQIADRQRYVCQSISANLYLAQPTRRMLRNFHLTTHKLGLKTGMYYLREPPAAPSPEYSRSSTKVRDFLTGPPMPLISTRHEPFRKTPATEDSDLEIIRIQSEDAPVCTRVAGCVSCGS